MKKNNIECYKTDSLWIFEECFGLKFKDLLIKGDSVVSEDRVKRYLGMINMRLSGIPVQYITGHCEFMGLDLEVGKGVLIPRDDTEVLVRQTIRHVKKLGKRLKIVDLCSGSGVIAISIKSILGDSSEVTAVELSGAALNYLKRNVDKHNLDIKIMHEDIAKGHESFMDKSIDCIVCNPPYIPSEEIEYLDSDVKTEPHLALDGGFDGLCFYRIICDKWLSKLSDEGFIAVEIGKGQSKDVSDIFRKSNLKDIEIYMDISNIERTIIAHRARN